jgi:hypothetical protein
LPLRAFQKVHDASVMVRVYDIRHRARLQRAFGEELVVRRLESFNERVLVRARDENIVGRDAQLRGVNHVDMLNTVVFTCPQFCDFPHRMRFAASAMSYAGSTMTGDFPPSSRVSGVRCLAAAVATIRAMRPFPV